MKYIFLGFLYIIFQIGHFIWHLKFSEVSYKEVVDNFNNDGDYPAY